MNQNIIKFYMLSNKLKSTIRTGWKEVGIPSEKIESVAEHAYGTLLLALAINSEYNLNLDMQKVYEMILIKQLEKINLEFSVLYTAGDSKEKSKEALNEVLSCLTKSEDYKKIVEELDARETKEAEFAYQVSKLESDLQAKSYELSDDFKVENAIEDAKNYPKILADEIVPQIKNASDAWILFDRKLYSDEMFRNLSKDIQDLK